MFGGVVALALVLLGGVALLAGIWLGLVESRGRMVESPKAAPDKPAARGAFPFNEKLVEAIGKLRGAALLLVIGAVVLMGAAWIAQSAVGGDGASTPEPSSSTAATPSGETPAARSVSQVARGTACRGPLRTCLGSPARSGAAGYRASMG